MSKVEGVFWGRERCHSCANDSRYCSSVLKCTLYCACVIVRGCDWYPDGNKVQMPIVMVDHDAMYLPHVIVISMWPLGKGGCFTELVAVRYGTWTTAHCLLVRRVPPFHWEVWHVPAESWTIIPHKWKHACMLLLLIRNRQAHSSENLYKCTVCENSMLQIWRDRPKRV